MTDDTQGPVSVDVGEFKADTSASRPKAGKSAKKTTAKSKPPANTAAKGQPWTFPKHTLEDAIRVAKAIEDKNAGNPLPAPSVAVVIGFRQAQDWRFLELLRSANQYGLVEGAGAAARISLGKLGQDIVAPSSPTQRTEGLFEAFRHVDAFKAVEKYYQGKTIPEDEFFLNTLTREFKVPRDRAEVFAKVFTSNLTYLRSFSLAAPGLAETSERQRENTVTQDYSPGVPAPVSALKEPRGREFLETCFVMMPFGSWFDTYYRDIYVPAIREAGFEPVRADELFTTGSVVEQIWEEIVKARLLLADLSGKNPNVFYELGLAHAAIKPVIFTACRLDDIPFDLRHLRVITYEIQDPEWGVKLRKSITDYLRNAAKEPEKSIPHPFRSATDSPEGSESKLRRRARGD